MSATQTVGSEYRVTKRSYALLVVAAAILMLSVFATPPVPPTGSGGVSASRESEEALTESSPRLDTAAGGLIINAHHYNLCSNVCDYARASSLNLALYLFEADGGWSLSLNEACFSDVMNLVERSGRITGYHFAVTKVNVPGCGTYGNAVLTIGNKVWGAEYQYAGQRLSNGNVVVNNCYVSSSTECRKMVCAKYDVFGIVTQACSTHLEPNNDDLATLQANDYTWVGTSWAGGNFRILAGDFNITPDRLHPVYRDAYRDGIYGNTFNARTGLREKIDYIFVQAGPYIPPKAAFCPTDRSDHCYTSTKVYF